MIGANAGISGTLSNVVVLGRGFAEVSNSNQGVIIGSPPTDTKLLGAGEGVIAINSCKAKPTENHPSGGQLYVEAGKLFFRGSAGKVTEIAGA